LKNLDSRKLLNALNLKSKLNNSIKKSF